MSTTPKRERWTDGKQDQLYEKCFTPLLTESSLDYLQALYEQTQYELQYLEAYTATDKNTLPQQKPTTRKPCADVWKHLVVRIGAQIDK